ncbi:MAG: helix-turn-helix transcriptional regulator [Propionibacteriales bacterium]|nr:helix-turn-helix transcriptional regulator [Propionibacteriales bacterium]
MSERRPDFDAEDALVLTGERLTNLRLLARLTQQQVADRAGISRGAVIRLEAGKPGPTMDTFFRVLNALHILDVITDALDPLKTPVGIARAEETMPKRVRKA